MITMQIYIVKVAIYLTAFYLIYLLLLRKDTAYGRNRAFLLLSLIASVFLPSLEINTGKPLDIQAVGKLLSEVLVTPDPVKTESEKLTGPANFIYSLYITGAILFLFKFLVDFSCLLFLILRQKRGGGRIIRFQNFNTAAFTALGYIFINARLSAEEEADVIRHERNHLRKNHYIDIIIIEFLTAFQWFNPIIHLLNRELRAIHEFQADDDCISSGIPVANYQSLLLSQIFRTSVLKLTNSFANPSLIRKRMIMMTRERTSQLANFKLLSVLPVTFIIFMSLSATQLPPPPPPLPPTAEQADNELPLVVAQEMPYYPGGNKALLQYISEHLIYPDKALSENKQGRVIIRFCVTTKGGISQVSVLKSVDPLLDAEAIRIVQNLPAFRPGKQDGRYVPVWYMVPITFSLD
jgi:TonB family protein